MLTVGEATAVNRSLLGNISHCLQGPLFKTISVSRFVRRSNVKNTKSTSDLPEPFSEIHRALDTEVVYQHRSGLCRLLRSIPMSGQRNVPMFDTPSDLPCWRLPHLPSSLRHKGRPAAVCLREIYQPALYYAPALACSGSLVVRNYHTLFDIVNVNTVLCEILEKVPALAKFVKFHNAAHY